MDPVAVVVLFLFLPLYFLPAGIAGYRRHKNITALVALNVVLGWTVLGWGAALVWSLLADQSEDRDRPGYTRPGRKKQRGSDYNPFE